MALIVSIYVYIEFNDLYFLTVVCKGDIQGIYAHMLIAVASIVVNNTQTVYKIFETRSLQANTKTTLPIKT